MKKSMKLAAGVFLVAVSLSFLSYKSARATNTRDLTDTLAKRNGTFTGTLTVANLVVTSSSLPTPPAAETIAAAATITANACGGLKRITAPGAVTTNTTNTFTAPSAANTGCSMDIVNVGPAVITLDNNALFQSAGGANVVLGSSDSLRVTQTGAFWAQVGATGDN